MYEYFYNLVAYLRQKEDIILLLLPTQNPRFPRGPPRLLGGWKGFPTIVLIVHHNKTLLGVIYLVLTA